MSKIKIQHIDYQESKYWKN